MLTDTLQQCLKEDGLTLTQDQLWALQRHCALIRMWDKVVSLVSRGDLEHALENQHVPDSLSLTGSVLRSIESKSVPPVALDIGSGGGFPAIPLAIALPQVHFHLVERSTRKRGFLLKVKGDLGLENVEVHEGVFPEVVPVDAPAILTARAVEKPDEFLLMIADGLPEDCTFLCQHQGGADYFEPEMFHVEPVEDLWKKKGLRRGSLWSIYRREE